ncbi:MAG: hypothetical protein ACTSXP_14525, partial [Promethearchaeota archaeon]
TAINRILFPYALKYIHIWEELMPAWSRINKVYIKFHAGASIREIIKITREKLEGLVNSSFEPGRDDAQLVAWINTVFKHVDQMLYEHVTGCGSQDEIFRLRNKAYIHLGGLPTLAQINKTFSVLKILLARSGLNELKTYLQAKQDELPMFFKNES